jgi:hypothetical protein
MVGWGGVSSVMEGGGLVGRISISRSFPKKTLFQGWAKKKSGIKNCPQKKKTELRNTNWAEKKRTRRKKNPDQVN